MATARTPFSLYQPRPGHPDWAALGARARRRAEELRRELSPPRSLPRDATRRARSIVGAARCFVENRRRARAGREDLLPLYFIWTTHRCCNFRCSYCDDHRGRRYPDLPLDGALDTEQGKRLLAVMRTRATSVYFAGGEPTLRKDLPELVRHARDLAYFPIIVNTNGSALGRQLAQPAWRAFLADVDIVVVSLDGLDLDWLARTWDYPHPEDVLETLLVLRELAQEMRVKLVVNTVIQPGALEQARHVLDLACDLGIWFSPVPQNHGPAALRDLHADPAYDELVKLILARKAAGHRINGSARLNRRLLLSQPLDCRNTLKPHVDHDGSLFWPCKASVDVEPFKADVLAFDHVDALWAHCTQHVDPAGFAGRCGARCNWAQNYSTDAYAHGLLHPLSLLSEVGEFLGAR
ncbi:MAG: radical SAM protein [bacterium]